MISMQERKAKLAVQKEAERALMAAADEIIGVEKSKDFTVQVKKNVGRPYSAIVKKERDWLWKNYFLKGVVHEIAGPPGVGKTALGAYLASHVSTGTPWADESPCELAGVIFCALEDAPDMSIIERLEHADADLDRVCDLSRTETESATLNGGSTEQAFQLPRDFKALEDSILAYNASLVLIDTVGAAFQSYTHDDFVRKEIMQPLARLADRYNVAVVLFAHPKKGEFNEKNFQTAIGGASCIFAASRMVYIAVPDNAEPSIVDFMMVKSNVGMQPMLRYRCRVDSETGKFGVQFLRKDDSIASTAVALIAHSNQLRTDILWYIRRKNGPVSCQMIVQDALQQGVAIPRGTIASQLSRLVQEGILINVSHGYYGFNDALQEKLDQHYKIVEEQRQISGPTA